VAVRQQRYYGAVNDTRRQIDEQQVTPGPASEERADPARPLRTWTHYGGMVPQQESANKWIRQNHEIRMAANDKPGTSREGEGAQPSQDRAQDQAELQEDRAAVEEARRREAAERARQQERERGGPER
jgi:hypothetical protein